MAGIEIDIDRRSNDAIVTALMATCHTLLLELTKEKGVGPWKDQLKQRQLTETKNLVSNNVAMADETAIIDDCLKVVGFVFDRIAFRE